MAPFEFDPVSKQKNRRWQFSIRSVLVVVLLLGVLLAWRASLERAERLARNMGFGNEVENLVVAMNRAAEAAVPEARKLLIDAARQMTVKDAKAIIRGGNTAGTAYFRRTSHKQLHARFPDRTIVVEPR